MVRPILDAVRCRPALAPLAVLLALAGWVGASCDNDVDRSRNCSVPLADGAAPSAPGCTTGGQGTDGGESSTDEVADADAGGGGNESDAGEDDTGHPDCQCLNEGDWYRFTRLEVLELDGGDHPVTDTLNELWGKDIEKDELNILFQIETAEPDRIVLRVVNGARTTDAPGRFCTLQDTGIEIEIPRDGCTLNRNEDNPAGINIYAGTTVQPKNCANNLDPVLEQEELKHVIPVRKAIIEAEIGSDCTQLESGRLVSGVIGKDALSRVCTCLVLDDRPVEEACGELDPDYVGEDGACGGCNKNYQSLPKLVETFGSLSYQGTTPSGDPAVEVKAGFDAQLLPEDEVPEPCP